MAAIYVKNDLSPHRHEGAHARVTMGVPKHTCMSVHMYVSVCVCMHLY